MTRYTALWCLGILALLLGGPAAFADDAVGNGAFAGAEPPAGAPPAPLAWGALDPAQREVLKPYADQWASFPPARQRAMARGAQRWLNMDDTARAQARERFQTWQSLPEARREQVRRRWEQFQRLQPEAQARVRENFRAFRNLPPQQRQQLRQRWLNATPAERSHMIERMRIQRQRRFGK